MSISSEKTITIDDNLRAFASQFFENSLIVEEGILLDSFRIVGFIHKKDLPYTLKSVYNTSISNLNSLPKEVYMTQTCDLYVRFSNSYFNYNYFSLFSNFVSKDNYSIFTLKNKTLLLIFPNYCVFIAPMREWETNDYRIDLDNPLLKIPIQGLNRLKKLTFVELEAKLKQERGIEMEVRKNKKGKIIKYSKEQIIYEILKPTHSIELKDGQNFMRIRILNPRGNWLKFAKKGKSYTITPNATQQYFTFDINEFDEKGIQGIAFIRGLPEFSATSKKGIIAWKDFRSQAILIEYEKLGLTEESSNAEKITKTLFHYSQDIMSILNAEYNIKLEYLGIIPKENGKDFQLTTFPSLSVPITFI